MRNHFFALAALALLGFVVSCGGREVQRITYPAPVPQEPAPGQQKQALTIQLVDAEGVPVADVGVSIGDGAYRHMTDEWGRVSIPESEVEACKEYEPTGVFPAHAGSGTEDVLREDPPLIDDLGEPAPRWFIELRFDQYGLSLGSSMQYLPVDELRVIKLDCQSAIILLPESRLTGIVLDDNGNPVEDAQVSLYSWLYSMYFQHTTDSAGKFEFVSVQPRLQILHVRVEGYAPILAGVYLFQGMTSQVVLNLRRPRTSWDRTPQWSLRIEPAEGSEVAWVIPDSLLYYITEAVSQEPRRSPAAALPFDPDDPLLARVVFEGEEPVQIDDLSESGVNVIWDTGQIAHIAKPMGGMATATPGEQVQRVHPRLRFNTSVTQKPIANATFHLLYSSFPTVTTLLWPTEPAYGSYQPQGGVYRRTSAAEVKYFSFNEVFSRWDEVFSSPIGYTLTTDENGEVTPSEGMLVGEYLVAIDRPGYSPRRISAALLAKAEETVIVDAYPLSTAQVSGRVIEANGAPVAGAFIVFVGAFGHNFAFSGEEGNFTLASPAGYHTWTTPWSPTPLSSMEFIALRQGYKVQPGSLTDITGPVFLQIEMEAEEPLDASLAYTIRGRRMNLLTGKPAEASPVSYSTGIGGFIDWGLRAPAFEGHTHTSEGGWFQVPAASTGAFVDSIVLAPPYLPDDIDLAFPGDPERLQGTPGPDELSGTHFWISEGLNVPPPDGPRGLP